jgi:hypothetical protein
VETYVKVARYTEGQELGAFITWKFRGLLLFQGILD